MSHSSSTQRRRKKGAHSVPHLPLYEAERNIHDQTKWSNGRKRAWKNRKENHNAYLYRFNGQWNQEKQDFDPEDTRKGKWEETEHKLFMQRIKEFGVNHKWGIFSTYIPGRCGYICSGHWKSLIKKGFVEDVSYFESIINGKKTWSQYKNIRNNKYFIKYNLRYGFQVNHDTSGVWHNFPQKHPKYPQNVQGIIEKIKSFKSNQETTTTTNTNSKCDETEHVTGSETEEDIENVKDLNTDNDDEKCGVCDLLRPGKIDNNNGIFYCDSCWNNYDTEYDESECETESRSNSESISELRRSKRKEAQKKINYVDPDTDDVSSDDVSSVSSDDSNNSFNSLTLKRSTTSVGRRNQMIVDDDEDDKESDHIHTSYASYTAPKDPGLSITENGESGRKRRREGVDDEDDNGSPLNKKRRINESLQVLDKMDVSLIIKNTIQENEENAERIKELEDEIKQLLQELDDEKRSNKKNKDEIQDLKHKLKESMKGEKKNDLELEKFKNVKKDLKELPSYQFIAKYPDIYK